MKKRIGIIFLALALFFVLGMAEETPAPQEEIVDTLSEVDEKLYELGYRDGACNGVLDEATMRALRNFQTANGLLVTGEPDAETVELLLHGTPLRQAEYLEALAQQNMDSAALAIGAYGDAVSRLQLSFKALGYYDGSTDGTFNEATEAAVCRFQLANGLQVTGIADGAVLLRAYQGTPVTWSDFLLECRVKAGDSSDAVHAIQLWLKKLGYYEGACTGKFGDETRKAVRRFQSAKGLEVTGEMDEASVNALFSNMRVGMPGSTLLRRGDVGANADRLCQDLTKLGYPAGSEFDYQTELALMEFQLACDLDVSGIADELTVARLRAENAPRKEDYLPSALINEQGEELGGRIVRAAQLLLGVQSNFESDFSLVQYVYIKSGHALLDINQLTSVTITDEQAICEGDVLLLQLEDGELCGIATADDALIYRAKSGYIVMSYLDSLKPSGYTLYRLGA